jgi:hypothetical protein
MTSSLQEQLEILRAKYSTYYRINKKHLAYGNVKATIAIMKEQIARLEHQIAKGGIH